MKTARILLGALLGSLIAVAPTVGQEEKPAKREIKLTLKDAIATALANNREIEISRYQPAIGREAIDVARGTYDVMLSASASGGENVYESPSLYSGGTEIDEDTFKTSIGLGQLLPTGMSYGVTLENIRTNTTSFAYNPNPRWNQSLGITLTLPLLKGGGIDSNYAVTVVAASLNRDLSLYEFERVLTDVVLESQKAFWELIYAIENEKVRRESLRVAEQFRDETKERQAVGRATELDVIQAEAGVAVQEEGVITAENLVRDAEDRLKLAIDPSLISRGLHDVVIAPDVTADQLKPPEAPLDDDATLADAFAAALHLRPDYRQAETRIASKDLSLRKAERSLLPKVDLTGSASYLGLDSNLGNAFDKTFDREQHGFSGGIEVEIPLGNFTARGERNRTKMEKEVLLLERKRLEERILLEIREAVREIKTVEKRIEATQKAERLAKAQFDAEVERRAQGLSTMYDVMEKQKEYTAARTRAVRAIIDHRNATLDLERAGGVLLERNDILVKDHLLNRAKDMKR